MKNNYLNFIKHKTIEIAEEDINIEALGDEDIAGHTVYSMISAGTEINAGFLDVFNWGYPKKSGYTVVFRVEYIGEKVKDIKTGDLVFCMAPHQSYQIINYRNVVKVPEKLLPEHALFARLAGVSMATLSRTAVTPGEIVLVTGLGTVGLMAMHIYSNLGYEVVGVDVDANRRETARASGFAEIYDKVPVDKYNKMIGLALECSGNESAVLECCNIVRPHGEVSLVGVPWKPYTDIKAYDLLHSVFYNYVKIYSGWECDLPFECAEFVHESMKKNYSLALRFLEQGKIKVDELYMIRPYIEAQSAYEDILEKREKKIATILSYN